MVFDLDGLEAEFGDQAAEIGVGIVHLPEDFDGAAVVQAKAVKVAGQFDFRKPFHQAVIQFADAEHERDSLLRTFTPMTILCAFFPPGQELGDQRHGLLQVGHQRYHRVAAGLENGVIGRTDVAEVAAVEDHLDILVLGGQAAENRRRRVG